MLSRHSQVLLKGVLKTLANNHCIISKPKTGYNGETFQEQKKNTDGTK